MAGVGAAESVSWADAADGFSVIVAEQIAVGMSARTTVVTVNMVNVQTDTVGNDWFSLGVGCRVPLYRHNYDDMTYWDDSDSSEDCGCSPPSEFDFYYPRTYEAGWERMYTEKAEGYWLADHLHEDGEFHGRGRCWKDRVFYLRFAGRASGRGDSTPGCSGCV